MAWKSLSFFDKYKNWLSIFTSFYLTEKITNNKHNWSFVVKMFIETKVHTIHAQLPQIPCNNSLKCKKNEIFWIFYVRIIFQSFKSSFLCIVHTVCSTIAIIIFECIPLCAEPERQITKIKPKLWRHKSLNSIEILLMYWISYVSLFSFISIVVLKSCFMSLIFASHFNDIGNHALCIYKHSSIKTGINFFRLHSLILITFLISCYILK